MPVAFSLSDSAYYWAFIAAVTVEYGASDGLRIGSAATARALTVHSRVCGWKRRRRLG